MTDEKDHALATLEAELAKLDAAYAAYRERRARLIAAITALRGESALTISPELKMSPVLQGRRAQAIEQALNAMPIKFSTIDIREYISKNFDEDIIKATRGSYLPTRLITMAKSPNPRIVLLAQGENGAPNVWKKVGWE